MKLHFICVIVLLVWPVFQAQAKSRSHEECIKRVPGDWGPNFGAEWHQKEALYWACRLGVSAETVRSWQEITGEAEANDIAQEIILKKVDGRQIVIFEEMGGRLHCFDVKALRREGTEWKLIWRLPVRRNSMDYCSGVCPRVELKFSDNILSVNSATTSDPDENVAVTCDHVRWQRLRFRWNGNTFQELTDRKQDE